MARSHSRRAGVSPRKGRLVVLPPEAVNKEMQALMQQAISPTPAEQEALWAALTRDQPLTQAQTLLGRLMRGER